MIESARADEVTGAARAVNLLAPVRSSGATKVIATLAVIATLWWGQRFLIPLAARDDKRV